MKPLTNFIIAASGNSGETVNNAWNLAAATWDYQNTYTRFVAGANTNYIAGLTVKPDGSSVFIYNYSDDKLYEYELRVPYKLGSMNGVPKNNNTVDLTTPDLRNAVKISGDGLRMYGVISGGTEIRTHVLTEAWNVATVQAADSANSLYVQSTPSDIAFANGGHTLYVTTGALDTVLSYTLSEAWNVATGIFDGAENYPRTLATIVNDGFDFNADGTKLYIAYDTTTANYVREYKLDIPFCVSTAALVTQTQFPTGSDGAPRSLFLKPDGTKLYMLGQTSDQITQLSLTTANDSTTMVFDKNFSVTTEETAPIALFFKNDGTKMYIVGTTGDDVNEYDLSTPWDIGTASFTRNQSISTETSVPRGIAFNNDGTKMFITSDTGTAGANHLLEYSLSEAWNVATISYTTSVDVITVNGVTTGIGGAPGEVRFNDDGTKCYIGPFGGGLIFEFDLSTGFDITTISARSLTLPQKGMLGQTDCFGVTASNNGTYIIVGNGTQTSRSYEMTESCNLATSTLIGTLVGTTTTGLGVNAHDYLDSSPDGTYVYGLQLIASLGEFASIVLSTAWNVATGVANSVAGFDITAQETNPQSVTFKDDGTKMYVIGTTGDDVNEYDLSTAWDVGSATYNQVFSVAGQETNPRSVTFSANGKYMYVAGTTGGDINQYTLGTEWNISTSVYTQVFAPGKSNIFALHFSPEGTKMYIGSTTGDLNEYTLGTAWDVSTASFANALEIGTAAQGVHLDPTGTIMFINNTTYGFSRWDLSTPWDISTATLTTTRAEEDLTPRIPASLFLWGMYVKSDGSKFYAVDAGDDTITSFSMV